MPARRRCAALVLAVLASLPGAGCRAPERAPARADDRPVEDPGKRYVGSAACRACHPENYQSWHASYHRTMTQEATPEAVRADFDGPSLSFRGYDVRLDRRGDEFWVQVHDGRAETEAGPQTEPRRVEQPVALVTGSHHMQIYWYPSGQTRLLEQLPFAWLLEEERWVPRPSIFLRPSPRGLHLETGRWNTTCLLCHTTNPRPGFSAEPDNARTRVSEFGISCEECHGPGLEHVQRNQDPLHRYGQHLSSEPEPSIVNPSRLEQARSVEVCGQCHGLSIFRTPHDASTFLGGRTRYQPGGVLAEERHLVRLGPSDVPGVPNLAREVADEALFWENRFWPDGMIRVTGREYNALVESPCYRDPRYTCLSCHDMHPGSEDPRPLSTWADDQLAPGMESDAACLGCHAAERFQTARHTHHAPDSEGARCYNCHMPYTTYGLLKAVRSHQVDSPDVAVTLETGRPNACNLCHLDRSLAWTGRHLEAWTGAPMPELDDDQRWISAGVLWALRGDAVQRALAAWSMGWPAAREASGTAWLPPYLSQLMMADPYDAVRLIAWRSLRSLPEYGDLDYDFMAAPEARNRSAMAAVGRWLRRDAARSMRASGATLVDSSGFRSQDFDRLLAQRDDRPLSLKE